MATADQLGLRGSILDGLENLEIHLHLTMGEANLILASLSELPFKVSSGLIQKIKHQGDQQVAAVRGKTDGESNPQHTNPAA